ncbi:C40 family peptidase [Nocardia pseudobrasiliensis]|uniref:Cell wall-associated NlpC family hydrolase n=1 Tax=Nocardia pseudobrasiliensis TaxID=45979 RepID=A0A370I571_9NOCA|nr:C40 family peptidase [Nocardia pseudobrasiliensis]RDI65281.1 cell wall-associated NlpC family hydrolase [Nocardia pseudobrasiliensis]
MAIKRQVLGLHRNAHRAVAAGAVGAATLSALLLPVAPASAAPVTVPGVGNFDVPDQVLAQIPPGAIPANILPPGFQIPGINPPAPAAPIETVGQRAVDAAMSKLGAPYVYGAAGPNAFDCSGLVKWSYEQAGLELPRTSYAQLDAGAPVSMDDLQPGDVVSFYGGSHSGLYVGDGNVVHASTAGQPVAIAAMSSMPVAGARRY